MDMMMGRRLVGPQSVVISYIGGGLPEEGLRMDIHGLDDTCQYQKELDVLVGRVAWVHEIGAVIPVSDQLLCLLEPLTPAKWLLMEKAGHAVASGHLLKGLHHNLVVVNGLVHTPRRWEQAHAGQEPPHCAVSWQERLISTALFIYIIHVRTDSLTDGAEVMVPPAPGPLGGIAPNKVRPV